MTAATQPSLEDILLAAIPGLPKVNLHNAFLASEVGQHFMSYLRRAAEGKLAPFILVMEGSIPNERNISQGRGPWDHGSCFTTTLSFSSKTRTATICPSPAGSM